MENTNRLQLPYILAAQAQKHVTHNEAIRALDALVQPTALDNTLTAPPASPSEGDVYIVAAGGTDAWSGKDHQIAAFQDGAWIITPPLPGWTIWLNTQHRMLFFDGTQWLHADQNEGPDVEDEIQIAGLGVGTAPDMNNRLAIKSDSVLMSHRDDGEDVRLVANKKSAADTASLVYQSNYSGRAEMGLAGDDTFRIKVSADGSNWQNALEIDPVTAEVTLPATPSQHLELEIDQPDKDLPGVALRGYSIGNTADFVHGVGMHLTYNATNNRQFAFLATDTKVGIRVVAGAAPVLDGYNNGARADLQIGSNTNGVHVGHAIANTQFSASNNAGTVTKTVAQFAGAVGQTGDLLRIGTSAATPDDSLVVTADKTTKLGGSLQLAVYTVATLPTGSSQGALIHVSDESGGSVPAFFDGTNWRRLTDRQIVS